VTGGDCCDDGSAANKAQSALIHPGADWQTTKATACNVGWDYNCSGHVDIELPGGSVVVHCGGSGAACSASYGSPVEADCGVASGTCATGCFTVNDLCVCGHYNDPKVHCR
jgi:hypothetical protein